jgi:predicted DNA-binding protein (MmcQ/YjbR family)
MRRHPYSGGPATSPVRSAALELPDAIEVQPFGPQADVYKVLGKIFAILSPDGRPPTVALKCEPELALHLRATHAAVTPGYHMNKKHWNTIALDGTIADDELEDMLEHSYLRVIAAFPRATRERLSWR